MKKLKIIFAGTAYFSAEYLASLITSLHHVVLVISQPDRPSGRGQKIIFSPVKKMSIKNKIPILQPIDLNDLIFQKKLIKFNADIMIVISYGKVIPKKILTIFPKGCINLHPSLLPRWRGSTPIQSAILNGDKKTGISIIQMNEKIDSGTIIHRRRCDILPKETTYSLSLKLISIGIPSLLEVLEKIITNTVVTQKQDEKNVVLSKKIYKKDGLLNWNMKAEKLDRLIRAFNPWPICYFMIENKIVKVWQASVNPIIKSNFSIGEIISSNENGIQVNTSYQILNLEKLQLPGSRIMNVKDILLSKKNLFKLGRII